MDRRGPDKGRRLHPALLALLALVIAAGAILLARSLVNSLFLANYGRGQYSEYPEKLLLPLALGENDVVPYNLGNAAYQRGDYERAARYYAAALKEKPPEAGRECAVRVNLALAMLHAYPFDDLNVREPSQVREASETLRSARSVLTEHGCACEEKGIFEGHSQEAESLKRDIDEMLDRLSSPSPNAGSNSRRQGGGEASGNSRDNNAQGQGQEASNEPTQEERQQTLKKQLEEQKQSLEAGSGLSGDFDYIDIGEMTGYGEGVLW